MSAWRWNHRAAAGVSYANHAIARRTAMTRFLVALWLVLGLLLAGAPLPAHAAGGGGGGGGDAPKPAKPIDPDYTTAVKAIKAGDYPAAMRLLEGVVGRDATNADAYNYLAYATRKNGDPAAAIPIYEKALAIDPEHRGAHEYIGEAYLQLDNLAKAKEHLAKLDKLCFFSCEEYRDLKKAVSAYEKSGGKVKPTAAKED
jgi:tetratricopeptide (TPR) repeat protein